MWDKEKPLTIINDEIVKIGGNVSGNIVVDIRQDRVILNAGAANFELRLKSESIKLSQPLKLHKEVLNSAFGGGY